MVLLPGSVDESVTLTGGGDDLAVLGCWVNVTDSVLTELSGCEVLVVNIGIVVIVVFKALGMGVETFPGAGGEAVFRTLSREVDIFPPGGGEGVLESLWEGVGFLPEIGAGPVLVKLGLEVVVDFLDGETTVFAVEVDDEGFLGWRVFGGG